VAHESRRVSARLRKISAVMLIVLSLAFSGGIAAAYNNSEVPCGKWPNGNPVGVQWKWGPYINQSGGWAHAFSVVAEPTWDDAFTKISIGWNSSAAGDYDVINDSAYSGGYYWAWCHWWNPTQLADFLVVGNLYWYADSPYGANMGRTAGQEIGHSLGLGHSSNPNAIMYGSNLYQGTWPTSDDAAGIASLYP
jgi:matrixin